MKAAHITITPELMKCGFDFNTFNRAMGSTGWTRNWWAIVEDHTAITANGSRDLVEHSYIMAGKKYRILTVVLPPASTAGCGKPSRKT